MKPSSNLMMGDMSDSDSGQTVAKQSKRVLDRAATEARLLKAFDRILCRDGVRGVRVNAILDEAGVGKALLYRYFGGIGGLAEAWAERAHLLPDSLAIAEPETSVRMAKTYRAYADALRKEPRTREFIVSELEHATEVTSSFHDLRTRFGRKAREILSHPVEDREAAHALAFIFTAATTYLAMRAATAPDYYGVKLNDDAAWDEVERLMTFVASRTMRK